MVSVIDVIFNWKTANDEILGWMSGWTCGIVWTSVFEQAAYVKMVISVYFMALNLYFMATFIYFMAFNV